MRDNLIAQLKPLLEKETPPPHSSPTPDKKETPSPLSSPTPDKDDNKDDRSYEILQGPSEENLKDPKKEI